MNLKGSIRNIAKHIYKTGTLKLEYPLRYRMAARRPVQKGKVVFLEVRQPELTDSFTRLYQTLEKQGGRELKTICLREGMANRHVVRRNALAAIPDIADAEWIFINDSCYFLSGLPLRPETKVIQLWHACGAFKKFGYSTADKTFGVSTAELDRYPVHRNFSYVTVSSPDVRWAYAEAFHMDEERILATGVSRTDIFYDMDARAAARQSFEEYLIRRGMPAGGEGMQKKILLYAPTFRGKVAQAVSPDVLDFEKMHRVLGDDWIFICKHHPFVKHPPVIPDACRRYAFDVSKELDIQQLLMVCDVCISDYSSLIFEYSLLERPMLFLDYDLEEYYEWRGFYYSLEDLTPGPIVRNTEEVIEYLQHLEERFDLEKVRAFRKKFMSSCDGHATERILQLMER